MIIIDLKRGTVVALQGPVSTLSPREDALALVEQEHVGSMTEEYGIVRVPSGEEFVFMAVDAQGDDPHLYIWKRAVPADPIAAIITDEDEDVMLVQDARVAKWLAPILIHAFDVSGLDVLHYNRIVVG